MTTMGRGMIVPSDNSVRGRSRTTLVPGATLAPQTKKGEAGLRGTSVLIGRHPNSGWLSDQRSIIRKPLAPRQARQSLRRPSAPSRAAGSTCGPGGFLAEDRFFKPRALIVTSYRFHQRDFLYSAAASANSSRHRMRNYKVQKLQAFARVSRQGWPVQVGMPLGYILVSSVPPSFATRRRVGAPK